MQIWHPPSPKRPERAIILPKTLALVHIIVGVICSIVAVPFIGLLLTDPTADPYYRNAGGIFLLLFALYFAPSIIGGIGLLFNAAWARKLLVFQAIAYLFLVPLGTALAIATFIILLARRPEPATLQPNAPSAPAPSPLSWFNRPLGGTASVLTVMAIVGPGFIVAIDLLYHLNEPRTPPQLDQLAIIALPIMLVASFMLIRSILMSDGTGPPHWGGIDFFNLRKQRYQRQSHLLTQDEHRRVKRLAADPVLRKYAALIRGGQHWSDEQIAYDQDRSRLVTCAHIQPIERAMRDAGIPIRPLYGTLLHADCCVDGPRLQSQFPIQLPVWFSDDIPGDRPYDPEGAAIMCREHQSGIWLLHPRSATPDTPWFPTS